MRGFVFVLGLLLAGCSRFSVPEGEFQNAFEAAYRARVEGPAIVSITGHTTLRVQSGQTWVPPAQAGRLLRAIGADSHPELLGLLVSAVQPKTSMALVYARDRRVPELPEIGIAGWREAPDLAGFRPR